MQISKKGIAIGAAAGAALGVAFGAAVAHATQAPKAKTIAICAVFGAAMGGGMPPLTAWADGKFGGSPAAATAPAAAKAP